MRQLKRIAAASVVLLALASTSTADAQLVTGWGLETGVAGSTLTEGVPGSFTTGTLSANAAPRALLASPIAFATVGSQIRLSGTVSLAAPPGNQQFRFGLYNTNGHATGTLSGGLWSGADPTGWLGYQAQVGGGGGANDRDTIKGRTATGQWLSNTGSYIVGDGPGGAVNPPGATPYDFTLLLQRVSPTSIAIDYSFVGGSINRTLSFVDTAGASSGITSFNAVGFLMTPGGGAGQFSNISVGVPKVLRLRVNTTTGFVSIANKEAATTFAPNYYEITSAQSSLTPTTWSSLDGEIPATAFTWEKAGGASVKLLAEANLLGSLSMPPQSSFIPLGKAFTPGGNQDLVFNYSIPGVDAMQRGIVEYVTGGPAGDFNVDGDADGDDLLTWQRGLGTAYTAADLDTWRNSYGMATPAAAPVPEPCTLALLGVAMCGLRRRRTRPWLSSTRVARPSPRRAWLRGNSLSNGPRPAEDLGRAARSACLP